MVPKRWLAPPRMWNLSAQIPKTEGEQKFPLPPLPITHGISRKTLAAAPRGPARLLLRRVVHGAGARAPGGASQGPNKLILFQD